MVERIKTFDNYREYKYELAGRPLVVKTGKIAGLANGAALVQYGETTVLATATASAAPREGIDFLPLSVDYDEKMYAVGKNSNLNLGRSCVSLIDLEFFDEGCLSFL